MMLVIFCYLFSFEYALKNLEILDINITKKIVSLNFSFNLNIKINSKIGLGMTYRMFEK